MQKTTIFKIVMADSGPLVSFGTHHAKTLWDNPGREQKINLLVVDRESSKIDTDRTSAINGQKAENISARQKTKFG